MTAGNTRSGLKHIRQGLDLLEPGTAPGSEDKYDSTLIAQVPSAARVGKIEIVVSRRTLEELSKKPDDAYKLAKKFEIAPYFGYGTVRTRLGQVS